MRSVLTAAFLFCWLCSPAVADCESLGDRPRLRSDVTDISELLEWFAAQPVSEDKDWKEPRYLQSLGELYFVSRNDKVLDAWEHRLKQSFSAIGMSEYIVTAGMLMTPYAWYLHAQGGDPAFKDAIAKAIRDEFDRWEPTWDGQVYRFATGRWIGLSQPQNYYAAISRPWLLYAKYADDGKVMKRALALRDLLLSAMVETPCNGIAWPYWVERDKIDDVSHGELVANALFTFNRFGYVSDQIMERIVSNLINNAFEGDDLSFRLSGGRLRSSKGVAGNERCGRWLRLAGFSTNLIRKCRPHLHLDAYRYGDVELLRYSVEEASLNPSRH